MKNLAAAEEIQDISIDTAEAYHASQIEEYNRTCKMCRFVQKKDECNVNICEILDKILEKLLPFERTVYVYSHVTDMAHVITAVESVLVLDFFARTSIIFRLLRRMLDVHLTNLITEDSVISIKVPDADREDPQILEHICFLLFITASASGISSSLKQYRGVVPSS